MRLSAWRIVKAKRAAKAFSGEGPRRVGGRWNSPGTAIVYAAGSPALAALEVLVHLHHTDLALPYLLFGVHFDPALVERLDHSSLPAGWHETPGPAALRQIGDEWAAKRTSVVLQVPSAVVPLESCFLLNPTHPEFNRVSIDL